MSDEDVPVPIDDGGAPRPLNEQGQGTAMLAYVLLLSSVLFWVTGLAAVIIAYVYKDDAPEWLQSHFQLQIRTFWISFLFALVGMLTLVVLVGYVVLLFWLIWFLVRCIKGMRYLHSGQPYPNPQGWLF
jgi:uncharacterized membrane protein